jgi:hypothetical protein
VSQDDEARRVEMALRWRLVLGRFADEQLGYDGLGVPGDGQGGGGDLADLVAEARQMDVPLSFVYDREHAARAHRHAGPGGGDGLSVPLWLNRVRTLFPREAVQVMEQDALVRYGLHELVTDADVLRRVEPDEGMLKAILQFKHLMKGEVLDAARDLVAEVVRRIAARLETACRPALHGVRRPGGRPPVRTHRNIDWRRTIRRNLRRWDVDRARLVVDRVDFHHRQHQRSPWRIIVAADQSGSMTDSLIHAAVMAAIFASLPAVTVDLVLWDHRVVDVSHLAGDPVEVLMSCQLGGGTRLAPALRYCADKVVEPARTLLVLLSDWQLQGERAECLALAKSLAEAGVKGIGLSALDADCRPAADEQFARQLAGCGWFVAAMTPRALAEHVGRVIA